MVHNSLEESYHKTILTIQSCKTEEQLKGASRMVNNFKTFYEKVGCLKILSYNLDRTLKLKQYDT